MRNDLLQILFLLLVLVFGAGAEELLPKFGGVGCPVLLVAVQVLAPRLRLPLALLFAAAAGAAEDALSGLMPMTSVSYFLLAAALVRAVGLPALATAFTFPCYQLWLAVWTGGLNVFTRILLSVPAGLLTASAVAGLISFLMRKAAIDECG